MTHTAACACRRRPATAAAPRAPGIGPGDGPMDPKNTEHT